MKNKRIFATSNIGQEAIDRLRSLGYEVEVFEELASPPKSLIVEKVRCGVAGLITTLRDPIDAEVLEAGRGTLEVIAQDAVGFDNIDREAANRLGVPFTNTADVLTHATAEFAFLIMGCAARRLYSSEREVRELTWRTWHPFLPFLGDELTGKTVGVVGTGRIGKAFALKCLGFDVDLLLHDVQQDAQFVEAISGLLEAKARLGLARKQNTVRYTSLDTLLGESDFISLHVPLRPDTRCLIDEPALRRMKPRAILVNTSRGPVVDEKALHRALVENWIGGAALDVFESEPLPAGSPLRDPDLADRLRLYHHFASGTRETRLGLDPATGMAGRVIQGLLDVLEGNYGGDPTQMPYVVNKEAFGKRAD